MKKLMTASCIAITLASTPVLSGNAPLASMPHITLSSSTSKPLSSADVRNAIIIGGLAHQWHTVAEQPGKITLKHVKRSSIWATLDISYDSTGYDINYLDSAGLDYRKEGDVVEIHPMYNRWIVNLVRAIAKAN